MTTYSSELNNFLFAYQIPKEKFEEKYLIWIEENQGKTFDDFIWNEFKNKAEELTRNVKSHEELYQNMRGIYFHMTCYKVYVNNDLIEGKEFFKRFYAYELLANEAKGLKMNVGIIGFNDCKKCSVVKARRTLEYEKKNQRLPFNDCPGFGLCRATYDYIIKRDENGLPISSIQPVKEKTYNLNSRYGRKKWREQGRAEYEKLSPIKKRERNLQGWIILIVILILVFLLLGPEGFMKWMQR